MCGGGVGKEGGNGVLEVRRGCRREVLVDCVQRLLLFGVAGENAAGALKVRWVA